jgi:hypothetical protein
MADSDLRKVAAAAAVVRKRESDLAAARDARDALMVAAVRNGESRTAVAAAAGVSRQYVAQLVERD